MLAVAKGRIITDDAILEGSNIVIKDNKIIGICDQIPRDAEIVDAYGNFISPGFIDIPGVRCRYNNIRPGDKYKNHHNRREKNKLIFK